MQMSNLETTKRERLEVHSSAAPDILLLDKSPKKPKTFKVDSASSGIYKLSDILHGRPPPKAANEELFSKLDSGTVTQSDIDLEAVEDNSEQYIEMVMSCCFKYMAGLVDAFSSD
ncbi:hypothetical protein HK102_005993 [Quaeritorhiza haematococci]|nr:hypothetical protein HK102_005993 [Quaeritorhiza haematococci]